jgi:hypothetical protein
LSTAAKLALLGGVLLPLGGMAQPGLLGGTGSNLFLIPSVRLTEVYDDNVFFATSQRQDDFITHISPALEGGYRTAPLSLLGYYGFDAEVFADHSDLNTAQARQQGGVDFRYEASRQLTVEAEAMYNETETPEELNFTAVLQPGRQTAETYSAGASLDYRIDPVMEADLSYTFAHDDLEGDFDTDTHTVSTGLAREMGPRDTVSVGYSFQRYLFDLGDDVSAHVPTVGWAHAFTPRTSVELLGGPRISDGDVDPEVSASIRHSLQRGQLSLTYARGESTVIGQTDTFTTEMIGGAAEFAIGPALEVRASASYTENSQGALDADVIRAGVEASYEINDYLSLIASYRYSTQQGVLGGPDDLDIDRNVAYIGVLISHPARIVPKAKRAAASRFGPLAPEPPR